MINHSFLRAVIPSMFVIDVQIYGDDVCSDYLFKVLLIGDSGVGKSCLLLRFAVWYLYFYPSIWFWSIFLKMDNISSKSDESAFYIYRMILIWRVTSVPLGSTLSVPWILFLERELWPISFIVIFLVGSYIFFLLLGVIPENSNRWSWQQNNQATDRAWQ